ncbi:hypothetical protein [Xylophilus sp.]|uniref:hypothetical protein n=1 Tax=Xylophilus sp. TaxID=2653893 RepID=UPI002D800586|nr:hypothetical protein [Xylophilus sp.]
MRLVALHAAVGYQTPGQRSGCRNCKFFEITRHDSPVIAPRSACTKHQLEVTSGGICPDYFARATQGWMDAAAARYGHRDLLIPQPGEARA